MIISIKIDEEIEKKLNYLTNTLNKDKSEVIKNAITLYSQNIENNKKNRILKAIEKTKEADKKINKLFD